MFVTDEMVQRARTNAQKYPWASEAQRRAVEAAQPWMRLSDDQLWDLMFGPTLPRAWQVWSNGFCPACKKPVPMYQWQSRPLQAPWKMQCPHCGDHFPRNDFAAFYRSGLDEHNVFDSARADRALLFNVDHPDPADPLHLYGVDDGGGYAQGEHRWRFIAAYLIHGAWKQVICRGIENLSAAYVLTGELTYAHKTLLLLDRVADLYPSFDFGKQGIMYEGPPRSGYVSTWHDANDETREMALGYDRVLSALPKLHGLCAFLSEKARRFGISHPKQTPEDVRRNIDRGILRDALENPEKVHCNYPAAHVTRAVLFAVLGWRENRGAVVEILDEIIPRGTAVDGVTGEKGLANYTSFTMQRLSELLAHLDRAEPGLLNELIERFPTLRQTWRFHIDTWCMQQYYPPAGDTLWFAGRAPQYVGVPLQPHASLAPSMFTFMWKLFEATGDAAYVQVLYHANGNQLDGLPHDLWEANPERFGEKVRAVIAREGPTLRLGSVNKQQWHLAILRAGEGESARAVWLDYDAAGGHGHGDGMNLGLFAKGLDLMPDFGYPPLHYGGWVSKRAQWYMRTASHNTVVVDGQSQLFETAPTHDGRTTLWAIGKRFRAVRASGPQILKDVTPMRQFERTVMMIDTSDDDSYVLDVFRAVGGKDHAKFQHSHFATVSTRGLTLSPAPDFGHETEMRAFRTDPSAVAGWEIDWRVDDRYGYLPSGADVHLRYIDLTHEASASLCESWVTPGSYDGTDEVWVPTVMTRRTAQAEPLESTFVAVVEPYENASKLAGARRLILETAKGERASDADVGVEVTLADGRRDVIVCRDVEDPLGRGGGPLLRTAELDLETNAELCVVRYSREGEVQSVVICNGDAVHAGSVHLRLAAPTEFAEIECRGGSCVVVAGSATLL